MAPPVASGGNDPDMALSAGLPGPHELAVDSVLQGGDPGSGPNPALLQAVQFGGAR